MSPLDTPLEIRRIEPDAELALRALFAELADDGVAEHFHPHPLDAAAAKQISGYSGPDLYYIMLSSGRGLGYGILRGWEAGFAVPSVGIALAPAARGQGLGRLMMHFLHAAARLRGADIVRLKVDTDNIRAYRLYEDLGYAFEPFDERQLLGKLYLREDR